MSDGKKTRSIWKRYDKAKEEAKKNDSELLYQRINGKTGRVDSNVLDWERSWKNVKILRYPTRYAEELRSGERKQANEEEVLAGLQILPEDDTAREFWRPTPEEAAELATINQRDPRDARRDEMFFAWRAARLVENAEIKRQNEIIKTRIDLEVKEIRERKDTTSVLMGKILEDMTKASREKIEKCRLPRAEGEAGATSLDEARVTGDWLYIFEAVRHTHLYGGGEEDGILMYELRELERDTLIKMKHSAGDFNRWTTRFEDQIVKCETVGLEFTEEAKIYHFMSNLNDLIFREAKTDFMNPRTRSLFPEDFEGIKQKMIEEYGQIMTRKPQLVLKVIRGEDTRKGTEASFKAEEGGCHVCGKPGHFYRSCEHYNSKFTLEQNKNYYQRKHKSKGAEGAKEEEPTKHSGGSGDKQSGKSKAPKSDKAESQPKQPKKESSEESAKFSMELDESKFTEAQLSVKEFSLIGYNKHKVIDLILDTGTVSNLVPEDSRDLLKDIHTEDVTLVGVGGAQVNANETGSTGIFGKARIVPGTGAICISQRQFSNNFQMLNPHKDVVILRGWPGSKYSKTVNSSSRGTRGINYYTVDLNLRVNWH